MPLHEAGKIRIIGYTGTKRNPQMPDIPTMIESGYPSVVSTTYYGLLGRHGLPADIVNRLNAATAEALKSPELQAGLATILFTPVTMSPSELAELLRQGVRALGRGGEGHGLREVAAVARMERSVIRGRSHRDDPRSHDKPMWTNGIFGTARRTSFGSPRRGEIDGQGHRFPEGTIRP